jgi:phage FluMu gp28-like protein
MPSDEPLFLPYQIAWIEDPAPLKIIQKSRQIGITWADAYDSVRKAGHRGARLDVWISSRDEAQAKLYIQDARKWAAFLQIAVFDQGHVIFDPKNNFSAYVLQFASGRRIYCLSSNPNALAGKRGHVKLDEFALHQDQRLLYQVAKPVTTWGGTLSIISTHRGARTVFNEIIRDIQEHGNPMGWSLHTVPIETAVGQGLVERINNKTGANESRESFLARLRAECIDEEQWLQEYCCQPADESAAFISYEMITSCEDPALTLSHSSHAPASPKRLGEGGSYPSHSLLYLGVDVARKKDLCVLDLGEKIGDVTWDRLRIELQNKTFSEIKFELWRLLRMTQLKRCCIDASGLGMQLAEEAKAAFGWKVEPITFTAPIKEELAFELRADFEDRRLRIVADDRLRADLRGIKKEVTSSNNLRFVGESEDSHCDRFWAKALRQHAARHISGPAVTL